jgi:outer membrane protein OmpA-like peptidoglycan-associated protein
MEAFPMRTPATLTLATLALVASATSHAAPPDADAGHDFQLHDSTTAKEAHGAKGSKLRPTKTEAAMKFIVVDKDKGPVKGVVIALTAPSGNKYYTEETDADGFAEVLVPVGQKYDLTYLSLGHGDIAATVAVTSEPNQNVKLTLRYKGLTAPPPFVLSGVNFDTAKATIRPESLPRLDLVVDFMTHKKRARIEISGHTDNVGNPKANKLLSEKRAQACIDYIVSRGIDRGRLSGAGYGDERPIAPNDSDEGRQKNRRIEAKEL